jgi:putative hydrolase of the HAD superfamily
MLGNDRPSVAMFDPSTTRWVRRRSSRRDDRRADAGFDGGGIFGVSVVEDASVVAAAAAGWGSGTTPVKHASYDFPAIWIGHFGAGMDFDAVLFDMGGVIISGPFSGFARYEREHGLPADLIRSLNAADPDTNAWAHFERGEIDRDEFCRRFEEEAAARGYVLDAAAVLASMAGERVDAMVSVIFRLRGRMKLGMITNNHQPMNRAESVIADVLAAFDAIVESSVEGVRKPDPEIYRLACRRLGVAPSRAVFLDDLGVNLKPARALGMHTIKVIDPDAAAAELADLLQLG